MSLAEHNEKDFAAAVMEAVVHVRRVMKRERHLDCRDERVGMFVTSLRRELARKNMSYMKNVCCTAYFKDAGELNSNGLATSIVNRLNHLFIKGVDMAGNKNDANYAIHELGAIVEQEQKLNADMDNINKEADKVLEGFKQLVSSM